MKKPSPLAARMLRAMIRHEVNLRMDRDHSYSAGPHWIDHDGRNTQLSLLDVKVKRNNVISATKFGWIAIYYAEKNQWNTVYEYYRITNAGREIVASLDEAEFYPKPPEISHDQLKVFMKKWYLNNFPTFLYLPELAYKGSLIDGYGISLWHSRDFRATAYEMKASRADLLSELRQPEKHQRALRISHQFFFVTPRKLASTGEIPDPCGLIEIDKGGRVHIVLDAPHRNIQPPGWSFVALLLRHAKKVYENRLDDAGRRKDRFY